MYLSEQTMLDNIVKTYIKKYAEQHHCTVEEAKDAKMVKEYVAYVEKEYGYGKI